MGTPRPHRGTELTAGGLRGGGSPAARGRCVLLPADGADLRGCGVGVGDLAIRACGVSKRYRLGPRQHYRALRETVADGVSRLAKALTARSARTDPEFVWALKDVSFEVRHGDVIGIIGRNGAGKSTLLKLLSRITEPTEGFVDIKGRAGALLEVGTGFHPELTGR